MTRLEMVAKMFRCTPEQLRSQYLANAKQLKEMHDKAVRTGKKVNKFSADQLKHLYEQAEKNARG